MASGRSIGRTVRGFEGYAEALAEGDDGVVACAWVGRSLAREGVDLGAALDGLRVTSTGVTRRDPSYAAIRALGAAWAEETLGYLHRITCTDPMTGIGTLAHLQACLQEVYAVGAGPGEAVLVVVEPELDEPGDSFSNAWWLVQLAERVRLALPGAVTVCRVTGSRLVVLTRRERELGRDLADLRDLVDGLVRSVDPDGRTRVWVEGLPDTVAGAMTTAGELSRRS